MTTKNEYGKERKGKERKRKGEKRRAAADPAANFLVNVCILFPI